MFLGCFKALSLPLLSLEDVETGGCGSLVEKCWKSDRACRFLLDLGLVVGGSSLLHWDDCCE